MTAQFADIALAAISEPTGSQSPYLADIGVLRAMNLGNEKILPSHGKSL
jgi:hypothetical protein